MAGNVIKCHEKSRVLNWL